MNGFPFKRPVPDGARRRFLTICLSLLVGLGFLVGAHSASAIDTTARQMILVDATTGTVLAEKNPNERMHPSSMSKLMTLYVAFGLLRDGKLKLEDSFRVSERAWRIGGSKMFLPLDSKVSVGELLKGIIIQSGNDACIVLAEGISGSEDSFAELLNKTAAEIGLTGSHFVNSTGWPDPEHYMTAGDLAILAHRIIHDFPQFYGLFSEKEYTYNNIKQGNRNPLLYSYPGADGLKTGHTEDAGYGLTASATRDGRRLILVANGMANVNERAHETERLLDLGFSEFKNYRIFKAGETVYNVPVWLGEQAVVAAVARNDIVITLPRNAGKTVSMRVVASGPALAPVAKDAPVAKLIVTAGDIGPIELDLVAGSTVGKVSGFGRIVPAVKRLFSGG